jgi:hypothetical protein
MDKKRFVNFLNSEGYNVKASQIINIEKLGTLKSGNCVGTELSDYKIETTKGSFIVSEELLPNRFGSTAFSTDTKFKITGAMATKSSFETGEENTDGESGAVTPEEL